MTQVKWGRQLGLAALLFVLGTVAYWLEFKHRPQKESKDEETKKIFSLKDQPVATVRIANGARTVTLRCLDQEAKLCKSGDNSKWEITEPNRLRADDANVNGLLSALNNVTVAETIDLSTETPEKKANLLKEYGLDDAAIAQPGTRRLEVTMTQGQKTLLTLGSVHPIGDTIFGLVSKTNEKSAIVLVPTYFKTNFDHDLTYWRNKKVLTIAAHEIQGFDLKTDKTRLSAERKDGQWILRASDKGEAEDLAGDIENIDSLLSAATYMAAKGFAADNKNSAAGKAALQGARAALVLTLRPEAPKEPKGPVVFTIFEKTKGKTTQLLGTVSNLDPVFELESGAKNRLDKNVRDLRLTKLISSMDRFSTKKMQFSGKPLGEKTITLTLTDGKWLDQDKKTVSTDRIQGLLDRLSGNRIRAFLTGSAIPKGQSTGVTITLSDEKTENKRKLLFWKNGDTLYARDMNNPHREAFVVDGIVNDMIPWNVTFFTAPPSPAPSVAPAPAHGKDSHGH